MTADLYPLQVLLVTLAGWVNRHQQHVIEYPIEENRVLKGQLKGRRLRRTDDQRRRLAARGAGSAAGSCGRSSRSSPSTRFCGGTGS
jgi:hypothetical protein